MVNGQVLLEKGEHTGALSRQGGAQFEPSAGSGC